jgi:steroid 5-alpha reductase family enzyme
MVLNSIDLGVLSLTESSFRVDRLWSLLPVYYSFHYIAFAAQHDLVSPRLVLLTGLQLVWGVRLTYNYWRKGGYSR